MKPTTVTKPEEALYLKALIYGQPGTGKTTLLGSANECTQTNPILILDFEGGISSLVGLDVDIIKIRSWKDFDDVYQYLKNDGVKEYKSIGIDSITECQIYSLTQILKEAESTRTTKTRGFLQLQDYSKSQIEMRSLVRGFRDLPFHIFFTALMKDEIDPIEGKMRQPNLVGQFCDEIVGLVDVCAYLTFDAASEIQQRVLLLQGFKGYAIKVRAAVGAQITNCIDDPTIKKLMNELHYGKNTYSEVQQGRIVHPTQNKNSALIENSDNQPVSIKLGGSK